MKSIFVICLVNFATLNNFLEANTRCAQKPNIRQIPLPTLAETYSATYEYTHSHITSILEENYDEKTDRVSLSMYVGNTTAQIFQSRDKTKELFKVEEGTCKQIQWDAKDFSFIDNFRKHTGIKHMLFLKEIIALSKAKKTIYLGRKKIFNDEIEVDAWEHCINGAAVRIYWTLKTEKTPASEIYPIKIWIKTPYKDDEYIYIFKFLPHHINETAINPPEEIFCPGRYNNRPMNGTLFLGNDMVFTSEVADPLNKRIYRTKHYYLIKQNLAQIIMPDLTVKPSMSQRYVPTYRYVFEYNLGEYYRIDIHTRKCTHNLISKFKEEVGEMFIMHQSTFENMKSLLDPEKVFYAGQHTSQVISAVYNKGFIFKKKNLAKDMKPVVAILFHIFVWHMLIGPIYSNDLDCKFSNDTCIWTRDEGWNKYLGSGGLNASGKNNYLSSPEQAASNGSCITVSFTSGLGTYFSVILKPNNGKQVRLYRSLDLYYYVPQEKKLTVDMDTSFKIIFRGYYKGHGVKGSTILHSISYQPQACADTTLNCDFEDHNKCKYTIPGSSVNNEKWKTVNCQKQAVRGLPKTDHTLGPYGTYLYMNFNSGGYRGSELVFERIPKGEYCIQFWYQTASKVKLYFQTPKSRYIALASDMYWQAHKHSAVFKQSSNIVLRAQLNSIYGWIAIDDIRVTNGICNPKGFCDFATDLCAWSNIYSEHKWFYANAKDNKNLIGGPTEDHRNTTGGYAFFGINSNAANDYIIAKIRSQIFYGDDFKCLKFWYFMSGENVGILSVKISSRPEDEYLHWRLHGHQKDAWVEATVPFRSYDYYSVIIEGKVTGPSNRSIAIDDVRFLSDSCDLTPSTAKPFLQFIVPDNFTEKPLDCAFDSNCCEWTRNSGWKDYLKSGGVVSIRSRDNMLVSPILQPSNESCFSVAFIAREKTNFRVVINEEDASSRTIYSSIDDGSDSYRTKHLTIQSRMYYRIMIVVDGDEQNALFGTKLRRGACNDIAYDCDFEAEDSCFYTTNNKWTGCHGKWKRHNSRNSTSRADLPKFDHTVGEFGSYFFIDESTMITDFDQFDDRTAVLKSSSVNPGEYCARVWYQMNGDAQLFVYVKQKSKNDATNYHEIPSARGEFWKPFEFTLNTSQSCKIHFEGHITRDRADWIAIDDVNLNHGACRQTGECDFKVDLCTWANMYEKRKWLHASREDIEFFNNLPLTDHKGNRGQYAYFGRFINGNIQGNTGRLTSALITKKYGCFSFWYLVDSASTGYLRVIYKPSDGNEVILRSISINKPSNWTRHDVMLTHNTKATSFTIILEANVENSSLIALDDVSFRTNSCKSTEYTSYSPTTSSKAPPTKDITTIRQTTDSEKTTTASSTVSPPEIFTPSATYISQTAHKQTTQSLEPYASTTSPLSFTTTTTTVKTDLKSNSGNTNDGATAKLTLGGAGTICGLVFGVCAIIIVAFSGVWLYRKKRRTGSSTLSSKPNEIINPLFEISTTREASFNLEEQNGNYDVNYTNQESRKQN